MKTIKALEAWEEIERDAHHARMRGEIERADILETAGLREFKRSLDRKIAIAVYGRFFTVQDLSEWMRDQLRIT